MIKPEEFAKIKAKIGEARHAAFDNYCSSLGDMSVDEVSQLIDDSVELIRVMMFNDPARARLIHYNEHYLAWLAMLLDGGWSVPAKYYQYVDCYWSPKGSSDVQHALRPVWMQADGNFPTLAEAKKSIRLALFSDVGGQALTGVELEVENYAPGPVSLA